MKSVVSVVYANIVRATIFFKNISIESHRSLRLGKLNKIRSYSYSL